MARKSISKFVQEKAQQLYAQLYEGMKYVAGITIAVTGFLFAIAKSTATNDSQAYAAIRKILAKFAATFASSLATGIAVGMTTTFIGAVANKIGRTIGRIVVNGLGKLLNSAINTISAIVMWPFKNSNCEETMPNSEITGLSLATPAPAVQVIERNADPLIFKQAHVESQKEQPSKKKRATM